MEGFSHFVLHGLCRLGSIVNGCFFQWIHIFWLKLFLNAVAYTLGKSIFVFLATGFLFGVLHIHDDAFDPFAANFNHAKEFRVGDWLEFGSGCCLLRVGMAQIQHTEYCS